MRRTLLLFALGALTSPLRAQEDPPPLQTWDSLLPFRHGAALWVRNPTKDTVWIDTLFVTVCRNVRVAGCGEIPLWKLLAPGETKELLRLHPKVAADPLSYRWTYSWRTMRLLPDSGG